MSIAVPVGFRFYPKDHELINYYLYNKVNGVESVSPAPQVKMPVVDTYNEEPWEIWERYERQCDESLYFFAILKAASAKGKRIDRRTKSRLGRWHEGEKCRPVDDEDGNQIGKMRKFRYESEHASHNAAWNLTEYSSSFSPDLVICNLRKNKINKRGNKRTHDLPRLESTSPEAEDIMPESKRLREAVDDQVADNTWTNMPSVHEEDSPQSFTNNGQQFSMPCRINSCYTNEDQQLGNGENLFYAANVSNANDCNNYIEDGFQTGLNNTTYENQQLGNGENFPYAVDLSNAEDGFKAGYSNTTYEDRQLGNGENFQYAADLSNVYDCNNFEDGFKTGSNNTTYENHQLSNGGNWHYASGLGSVNDGSNYFEDGFQTGSSNTTYEDQQHGNGENLHYAADLSNFNDRNYFEDGLETASGDACYKDQQLANAGRFHYTADPGSSMPFSDVNDCNDCYHKKELQEISTYQSSDFTSKSNLVEHNDDGFVMPSNESLHVEGHGISDWQKLLNTSEIWDYQMTKII